MSAWPATGGLEAGPVDQPALMSALGKKAGEAPVGVAIVQNSCIAVLVAELRASCQQTAMLPERGFDAIRGRKWPRVFASSFTRIGGLLQVPPLSSEKRTMMSVSLFSLTVSSV